MKQVINKPSPVKFPVPASFSRVEDQAERAFLDLQDAKSAFLQENNDFKQKNQTYSNGFFAAKT